MLNQQGYYRIGRTTIVTLQRNEPDRWVAGQEKLTDMAIAAKSERKGPAIDRAKPMFNDEERDRIVALKVLADVGVYKPEYVKPIGPQLSELMIPESEQVH